MRSHSILLFTLSAAVRRPTVSVRWAILCRTAGAVFRTAQCESAYWLSPCGWSLCSGLDVFGPDYDTSCCPLCALSTLWFLFAHSVSPREICSEHKLTRVTQTRAHNTCASSIADGFSEVSQSPLA